VALVVPLCACSGGDGGNPNGPTDPDPTYQVTVTLFYDENGNGQLDGGEGARVPGVEVVIGAGSGASAPGTGQALVTGIRAGSFPVSLRTGSIPTFYQAAPEFPVQVPGTTAVSYPLVLPIGGNGPSTYLGYGDSITLGESASDGNGYVLKLQNLLGPHFGRAEVRQRGRDGDTSQEGADNARRTLKDERPAYTLVLIGTNDWTDNVPQGCQDEPSLCDTIDNLRTILDEVKSWQSLPVLATLTPVNPALAPSGRNDWIDEMNVRIRALAQQEGALLVDANAAFKARGDLSALFVDDVHPNDAGYEVLAQAWFDGISRGRAEAASRKRVFGFAIGD
jgi:lysophospholipase L1-like esterase